LELLEISKRPLRNWANNVQFTISYASRLGCVDKSGHYNYTIRMVDKITRRPSQKNHLLESAVSLVARQGVEALTIEKLAQAAGVTKGGVQYHFHTKDLLVTELLSHLLAQFDNAIGPDAQGAAWLRAYVAVSLANPGEADGVAAALLAALPPNDPRAEPFRLSSGRWRERCEAGVADKALAQLIRMATDSVCVDIIYGGLTASDLARLKSRLFDLIDTLR
jgi:AcrR family transcriptional regulator